VHDPASWFRKTWFTRRRVRELKNAHNSVTVQNRIHVYMNFFHHKDLGNHLLQLCPKVVKHPLYVHPLWFYKHQHENQVRSRLFVECQRWWVQWRFWFLPSVLGEMHNYCTPHIMKENFENFSIHRCGYILLSQVYCVWQVVKTPTIILNNPVEGKPMAWTFTDGNHLWLWNHHKTQQKIKHAVGDKNGGPMLILWPGWQLYPLKVTY